jgi:hypothetical protein
MNWSVNRLVVLLALFAWLLPGICIASDNGLIPDYESKVELKSEADIEDGRRGTVLSRTVLSRAGLSRAVLSRAGLSRSEWESPLPGDPQDPLRRLEIIQDRRQRAEMIRAFGLLLMLFGISRVVFIYWQYFNKKA